MRRRPTDTPRNTVKQLRRQYRRERGRHDRWTLQGNGWKLYQCWWYRASIEGFWIGNPKDYAPELDSGEKGGEG